MKSERLGFILLLGTSWAQEANTSLVKVVSKYTLYPYRQIISILSLFISSCGNKEIQMTLSMFFMTSLTILFSLLIYLHILVCLLSELL